MDSNATMLLHELYNIWDSIPNPKFFKVNDFGYEYHTLTADAEFGVPHYYSRSARFSNPQSLADLRPAVELPANCTVTVYTPS